MSNVLKDITNGYRKVNKSFDQVSIIILILAIGFLIIYSINNPQKSKLNTDISNFKCPLTATDKLITLDTNPLQTATQLALINPDTEVFSTSLGKNDIPAITEPIFTNINEVSPCITDNEPILLIKYKDEVRLYPRLILNYHVAIDDKIGDLPILITYSPLAGHFQVFKRNIKNEPLMFGVAGSLYKNTDLLFDTKSESLWSQFDGRALVGNMIGAKLETLPFNILSFKEASKLYPDARILSFRTGFQRSYEVDPFNDYRTNEEIIGKTTYSDTTLKKKSIVYGFQFQNKYYALDKEELINLGSLSFLINNSKLTFTIEQGRPILVDTTEKIEIPVFTSYWFVWYDFYPNTEIINF